MCWFESYYGHQKEVKYAEVTKPRRILKVD